MIWRIGIPLLGCAVGAGLALLFVTGHPVWGTMASVAAVGAWCATWVWNERR